MAFPVVEGTATSTEDPANTSHTVSLPGSIVSGETLIVIFALQGQDVITWPGGWTEFFTKDTSVAGDRRLACAYRKADGGEGATITVTTTGPNKSHHQSYRISSADDPTVRAPEGSAGANGESTTPDPDSLTPTGGAKDYLWLSVVTNTSDSITYTAAPTSYTDLFGAPVGSVFTTPASARRELNAASEDPGTFTMSSSGIWVAGTLVVHPVAAAAIASQRLKIGHGR